MTRKAAYNSGLPKAGWRPGGGALEKMPL